MRRKAIGLGVTVVGALLARGLAPRLHSRLAAGCERMFEQMPDTFPPKRMMRGIEQIHANSLRTVELLEARETEKLRRNGSSLGAGASILEHDPLPVPRRGEP